MSICFARVTFADTSEEHDDFVIDLLLDEHGQAAKKISMTGTWGGPIAKRESVWPLIYRPGHSGNDVIDFGTFPEEYDDEYQPTDTARVGRCNISEKAIVEGEYVTFWLWGDTLEICCRIKAVKKMIEGDAGNILVDMGVI